MKKKLSILIIILTILSLVYYPDAEDNLLIILGCLYTYAYGLFWLLFSFDKHVLKRGAKYGSVEKKWRQLDKTDFENTKTYYRDILKEYSPIVLGYIDNQELNNEDIIAELLYLKKCKLIDIKDNKIVKLENYDKLNLSNTDKVILNKIIDGKLIINDMEYDLRNLVEEECEKKNLLLIKKTNSMKLIIKLIIKLIFILICTCIVFLGIHMLIIKDTSVIKTWGWIEGLKRHNDTILVLGIGIFMGVLVSLGYSNLFVNGYKKGKGIIYKRTSKGSELNQKLEGLKKYLKDYSMLSEREEKEIELWEEYLIYSVMFDHNKKIIEEYEKYLEIEKNVDSINYIVDEIFKI